MLWSLRRDTPSKGAILRSGHFVVNVLHITQLDLAQQFARPTADKFDGVEISTNCWGAPYIEDCIARFECKVINCLDGGDHVIFLGEVEHFHHETGAPPVYCHGMFASAQRLGYPTDKV